MSKKQEKPKHTLMIEIYENNTTTIVPSSSKIPATMVIEVLEYHLKQAQRNLLIVDVVSELMRMMPKEDDKKIILPN